MRAVIDRFEGDYAVILFGDQEIQVDMPKALLPKGIKEGDILNITFKIDKAATATQKDKIEGLLEKLRNKENK